MQHCRVQGVRANRCKRGHPLTDDNIYVDPRGRRPCRSCIRLATQGRNVIEQVASAPTTARCISLKSDSAIHLESEPNRRGSAVD